MRNYIPSLIIGVCIIIAILIIGSAARYKFRAAETITVTGLAEQNFTSDLIVWQGSYSRKSMDLKTAFAQLKQDEVAIQQYLARKGVQVGEIVFSSHQINKEFNTRFDENGRQISQEFSGYNLTQSVRIESKDVEKIDKLSREATELIESGIEFNSSSPAYYYSKLAGMKIDLLAKASEDARQRAETIAKNAGNDLGKLKKANMGVFQITGQNSNEDYSYGGAFNTADKMKTGSITIKMEFSVD
jgi:hypothetical protein